MRRPRLRPHHLRERRHVRREVERSRREPATARCTASASKRSTATGSAPAPRSCAARFLAPRDGPHLVARRDQPAHRRRPITPVAPVRNTFIAAPPASSGRLAPDALRATRPFDHCWPSGRRADTRAQLLPPRLVGLVHHRVDRARHRVLTGRPGRRARGGGSRRTGTRARSPSIASTTSSTRDLGRRAGRAGTRPAGPAPTRAARPGSSPGGAWPGRPPGTPWYSASRAVGSDCVRARGTRGAPPQCDPPLDAFRELHNPDTKYPSYGSQARSRRVNAPSAGVLALVEAGGSGRSGRCGRPRRRARPRRSRRRGPTGRSPRRAPTHSPTG